MIELVDDFYLRGDLDGDGLEEYVAILKESSGTILFNGYAFTSR